MKLKILGLMLILSLTISGCAAQPVEPEVVIEKETPVELMDLKYTAISTEMVYGGRINPSESVTVAAKTPGKVAETLFDVGDTVVEGSVLFRLDEQDVRNQIRQLQSQLTISEQGVKTAQNALNTVSGGQFQSSVLQLEQGIEMAEKQLEASEIALSNAELALTNAENNLRNATDTYNNIKILYDAGTVSKSEFDRTELAFKQATTAYNQAQNAKNQADIGYQQAESGLKKAKDTYSLTTGTINSENVERARLAVNQAAAQRNSVSVQLQIAQNALNDLEIKSPISGVVSSRNANKGEYTSSAVPAFTVVKMDTVNVEVKISELLINLVKEGEAVDVTVKTLSDEPIKGKISSISPAADQTSTFPIKIEIDNTDGKIKPGMFAEIRFIKDSKQSALVVPRNTVLADENDKYVFVNDNGRAKKVVVTTGIDNGKDIEITSGLTTDDKVVVRGQSYLTDGDKLKTEQTTQPTNNKADTVTEGA